MIGKRWNQTNIVVDNIFAYNVVLHIISENKDYEPKSIEECRQRKDWSLWKKVIDAELNSL